MSKDSLIKGTIILAVAALAARFLGIVQRVPLDYLLGKEGGVSFGTANNIYLLLLVVATAGIPSTLSKMISERTALGRYQEAQRIYRAAIYFGAAAGLIITVSLYVLAPFYANHISKVPESVAAIRALAPALLVFPLIAMMRGYFQGRQMMMAGGISQIVEQILRVFTAIFLAYLFLQMGYQDPIVAAGASFGGVMGSIGALAVMLYYSRRLRQSDQNHGVQDASPLSRAELAKRMPYRKVYGEIFRVSIPIVLTAMAVPMIYFIDSSIVVRLTEGLVGTEAAKASLDVLTIKAQSLAGIPPILAIALSQSIIPVISAAYAKQNHTEVARQASQALRISIFSGLPVVIAMTVAARPINGLLFEELEGTGIIALLTFGTIFQIIMMTSGSILLGLGLSKIPMVNVFAGLGVKLAGSFILAPFFGIYGIIVSTTLCFLVTTLLNLSTLRRRIAICLLKNRWTGFLLTVSISAGVGYILERVGQVYLPGGKVIHYGLNSLLTGGAVLVAYLVLLGVFRVITAEDLRSYPFRLQKIIYKFFWLIGRPLPSKTNTVKRAE